MLVNIVVKAFSSRHAYWLMAGTPVHLAPPKNLHRIPHLSKFIDLFLSILIPTRIDLTAFHPTCGKGHLPQKGRSFVFSRENLRELEFNPNQQRGQSQR